MRVSSDKSMKVRVSMPAEVEVELVQMNDVRKYTVFQDLFSVTLPIAVGFWVGWVTTASMSFLSPLFYSATAFTLLAIHLFKVTKRADKSIQGRLVKIAYFSNFHRDGKSPK